jgi:capsular polysaccharide transport system permease protein
MMIATFYYSFFALDRYASQTELIVRQPGATGSPATAGLALLVGAVNPTSREETLFLQTYITSSDMLDALEKALNWSDHYKKQAQDPLYWLASDSYKEDVLEYYRRVVTVKHDATTGLLNIKVEAFDPAFAKQMLEVILSRSQVFVNEISHQMAREQLRFAESELSLAKASYENKRQTLVSFQENSGVLDLEATATARATVINEIEAQLVKERAALATLRLNLSDQSPQVTQLRNGIMTLEQQLKFEIQKLTSSKDSQAINQLASQYRELTVNAGIAEEIYKLSIAAAENARIEAIKQLRALVVVVSPNLPEDAIYPKRLYNLTALLLGLLMLYGIFRFLAATIQDHKD